MKDLYEILNIDKGADQDEIRRAYRKLAKKYHPDLNPDDKEAEQRFKEVSGAYEILKDPEKRERYDRFGHAGIDPQAGGAGGAGFGGFEDIFGDIFDIFGGGGFSERSRRRGPVKGRDLRYDLDLEFREAVFGVEKEIRVNRMEECSTCSGSGAKPGTDKRTCSKCNGSGEVQYAQQTPLGQFVRVGTCDECQGEGEIIEEKCTTCHGAGRESKNRRINIKVPAGVDNGSVISLRGEGEGGEKGGPAGDLYIYLNVKEDKVYRRKGNNLYIDIPISFTEATLGAEIEVPVLEGVNKEEVEYFNIPEGTQTGSQFRLRNKGVPNLRRSGRGDLFFNVNIETPKELTDRQKELLLEFAEESGEVYKKNKKGFFEKVKDAFN